MSGELTTRHTPAGGATSTEGLQFTGGGSLDLFYTVQDLRELAPRPAAHELTSDHEVLIQSRDAPDGRAVAVHFAATQDFIQYAELTQDPEAKRGWSVSRHEVLRADGLPKKTVGRPPLDIARTGTGPAQYTRELRPGEVYDPRVWRAKQITSLLPTVVQRALVRTVPNPTHVYGSLIEFNTDVGPNPKPWRHKLWLLRADERAAVALEARRQYDVSDPPIVTPPEPGVPDHVDSGAILAAQPWSIQQWTYRLRGPQVAELPTAAPRLELPVR